MTWLFSQGSESMQENDFETGRTAGPTDEWVRRSCHSNYPSNNLATIRNCFPVHHRCHTEDSVRKLKTWLSISHITKKVICVFNSKTPAIFVAPPDSCSQCLFPHLFPPLVIPLLTPRDSVYLSKAPAPKVWMSNECIISPRHLCKFLSLCKILNQRNNAS